MSEPGPLPLPTLLSRTLGRLAVEVEAAAGVGPTVPPLAVWSNLLRCVADAGSAGLDERALPAAARISSRLATAMVTAAERQGWVTAAAGASGGKSRLVALTDAGRSAAATWPPHLAALDGQWAGSPLRSELEALVGQLELELSHFPSSYGVADPSALGGPFVQPWKKPGPAHGTDWKPVARAGDADTVSSLPITALLSQALMAFTIDYESAFPWPLASTANVLRHIAVEPRPLAEVPGDHGIAGNGKSLLERHLIVSVTPDPGGGRRKWVALTERGVAVLHHHPARLDAVHADWQQRYGEAAVRRLRAALEEAVTAADPALPDHVVAPLHPG